MAKQESLLAERWVILLPKKEADEFEETDFKVIYKTDNLFSFEYQMLLIESLIDDDGYTAEDVLVSTGALAVHEEWTNGVITTPDNLEEIADGLYPWNDGGNVFFGDMLTDAEKLSLILKHFTTKHGVAIDIEDLDIREKKNDTKLIPLADNIKMLFTDEPYEVIYQGVDDLQLWFADLVRDKGYFLVCIDDSIEIDTDDDEPPLLPAPRCPLYGFDSYQEYYEEIGGYPWGDAYYDRF